MIDWAVTPDWTLFLDRDGVINRRLIDEYVRNWSEFEFEPGVLEALAALAPRFRTIVIVTNQRGIARGLMTEADLARVHERMSSEIEQAGGRIDGIYHCPHDRHTGCACRKPGIGLAEQARRAHPHIDFTRSLMVGDSASDMEFADRAGMKKLFIGPDAPGSVAPGCRLARLSELPARLGF